MSKDTNWTHDQAIVFQIRNADCLDLGTTNGTHIAEHSWKSLNITENVWELL